MPFLPRLRRYLPRTLRGKLLALLLIAAAVPLATVGYMLEHEGRQTLMQEKQHKLFGVARILDSYLGDGFGSLLSDYSGDPNDRLAMVRHLNAKLARFTDQVAAANPGIGVGYFDKSLGAIITYGPSQDYGDKVGEDLPADHPGRHVLESGEPDIETGPQVRGRITNAMWPIVRNNEILGYIWANELSDDIRAQETAMDQVVAGVTVGGLLFSLILAHLLSRRVSRDVKSIIGGLARMRTDLHHRIVPPADEIGEIAVAVNAMARTLLDTRSLTENILISIADGVIAIDREGRITSMNPAACRMLDVTRDAVSGRPYTSLFDQMAPFSSVLLDTLENGRDHIGVEVALPLPEQTLQASISTSLLRDSRGTDIGAVIVLKDLTERHRLRTQIMQADRLAALGELTAGIAHEIRNPLTSIRGFMQFLENCDDLEEWRKYAPLILRQVDSLNRIVTDLLEFGRPRPPSMRPVQANDLVREVVLLVGRKSGTEIRLDLTANLPMIEADGEAIKQALLNLLINAMQSIHGPGLIHVATGRSDPSGVTITVSDNGVGIPQENLGRIFDPFFSTKPDGTGLGLAMVHRIVDAHHGVISIKSRSNVGTVATLALPLRNAVPVFT